MDYIHIARQAAAAERCKQPKKAALRRDGSRHEADAMYYQVNFHLLHCVHDKSYFTPCAACKRDTKEAKEHLTRFLLKCS